MAVHQYTPHRSGIISAISDNIVIGYVAVALSSFIAGAATSAILINWDGA